MAPRQSMDAAQLKEAMLAYRDALKAHQEAINRLNVYPVPDGDTGTNMALTLEAVASELEAAPPSMAEVCSAVAHGSLMGARGNSGVILSQLLRGACQVLSPLASVGPRDLARALAEASRAADQAVMRPVEGTILTVARRAAEEATAAAAEGAGLVELLERTRKAAAEALAATPEMLAALKQAGVVDAGGAGFVLLVDALLFVADGRPLPAPEPQPAPVPARAPEAGGVGALRYEVTFLLEAPEEAMGAFKEVWAGLGDSIVVVGDEGLWSCHIHTDDVGGAIEAGIDAGRPRRIQVTDLAEQVQEERWVREAGADGAGSPGGPPPGARTAVVAVATGEGVQRIFRSLGVDRIVAGGQSMNPSTSQILDAVEQASAPEVVVLPNNDNISAVASQAADLSPKRVEVVPTRGIAEGLAALMEYDPFAPAADNARAMAAASGRVVAGEVTRAQRSSRCWLGPIAEGDWIALSPRGIEAVDKELVGAVCSLLERLVGEGHELVTLIEGEGASRADTRRVTEWLSENRPGVEAEVHYGGQPLYAYLVSVE